MQNKGSVPRRQIEYRFFTTEGEVSLEEFLATVARRGEAKLVAEDLREPAYRLTSKGRAALAAEEAGQ